MKTSRLPNFLCTLLLAATLLPLQARPKSKDDVGLKWLDSHFEVLDSISKAIHAFAEPGHRHRRGIRCASGTFAGGGSISPAAGL